MTVRPRRLVHRGVVRATALFVAHAPLGEARARERVLAMPFDRVQRVPAGWVVHLRAPAAFACDAAPGVPLVMQGSHLASAPLEDDERAALAPGLVLVTGGVATTPEAVDEDPSLWLDVACTAAEVTSLGLAPPAALVLAPARQVREAFGKERLAPGLAEMVSRLRAGPAARTHAEAPASAAPWLLALAVVARAIASLFRSSRSAGTAPPGTPTWLDRLDEALRRALANLVLRTRIADLLGRKHAEYIARMMQLFEEGKLEEALRYAIPLRGEDASVDGEVSPALLPPTPRAALDIPLGPVRRAAALGLESNLFDELRARYRAAFDRLSAAGRHADAAFVLVELLGEVPEAVSYLERHRLFRLAAEVAEARKLSPGLVVRQWFLAGDAARAAAYARVHDAFADAVTRLEASDPDAGKALRLLWAEQLAASGDYAAAVDVAWPIEDARPLARAWMDRAIEAGGVMGARMLARKAAFASVRTEARALFDEHDLDLCLGFATELAVGPATAETRVLARGAARLVGEEPARSDVRMQGATLLARLLDLADDPVLRADLTAAPRPYGPARVVGPATIVRPRADAGAAHVHDAVPLRGGRVLVALGEAGARVVGPDGRVVMRFAEPTHRIVASDLGDRAILVAARGQASRLARLDLILRRIAPWRDVRIDAFAQTFDGATWIVAEGAVLHAMDVLDDAWRSLWNGASDASPIVGVEREERTVTAIHEDEMRVYELPGYVLRRRGVDVAVAPRIRIDADTVGLGTGPDELTVTLAGGAVRARLVGGMLVVFDDRGRVLAVDPRERRIRGEWRVS